MNLKREGVKSGVPDLCLAVARGGYHGLYIEMKRKGQTTSDNQKKWIAGLKVQGYEVSVAYSCEEAIEVIKSYLDKKIEQTD